MQKYNFMLAKSGDEDILNRRSLAGFIFEPDFGGIRVLVYIDEGDIELIDSFGNDIIFRFPEFLNVSRYIKTENCVLDAEIIIFDSDKKINFNLLQKRAKLNGRQIIDSISRKNPAKLFISDILEKDNQSLTEKFLGERKKILKDTIIESAFTSLHQFMLNYREMWKQIQEKEIQSMLVKELNSTYVQGKESWSWLKIKNVKNVKNIDANNEK